MSFFDEYAGKMVLIVGMARSGVAAAKLAVNVGAKVIVNDQKPMEAFENQLDELKSLPITWKLGCDTASCLDGCDVLLISPGVPIDAPVVKKARKKGIQVTGELEFAAVHCPCTLLAVTGTNGKTTTVSLLGAIFDRAGRHAIVAGNVGYPLSAAVLEAGGGDVVIAEVSSFQLETTQRFHPCAAAVLNVTEDHLNRHGTMEVYTGLKRHIFDAQMQDDVAVLNYDDPACRAMAQGLKGRVAWFSRKQEVASGAFVRGEQVVIRWQENEVVLCRTEEIYIPGPHNLENALAASLMAFVQGVPAEVICQALREFHGVEHRIEFVRELHGVRYINDSKGTNVDSTIKAVWSMKASTVLILGGCDKHVSFDALAREIKASPFIAHCVLIGETAGQIEQALQAAGYAHIVHAASMQEAVCMAQQLAVQGGNVVLSPACASFDMFKDYEERGRVFKALVQALQ